jgi:hypothetical protein
LNWKSLTARKYKIGLINCLLNRIWRICTIQEHRNEEVKRLKIISLKNEYPENIINQTINKYISRITLPNQPKPQKETKRFIVLPFVNKKAEDFAVRLKSLVEESYSQVDFIMLHLNHLKTIGSLFPFKDQIKEKTSQSLVVYKINCKTCNVDCIGKTERILVHRLKKHQQKETNNKQISLL